MVQQAGTYLPSFTGADAGRSGSTLIGLNRPWAAQRVPQPSQAPADLAQERNGIARELHDAVSQNLFASNLLARALARDPGADETVRVQARALESLNRSALAEMRMMLFELRPEALESVRMPELLQQTVEALEGRGGVQVHTQVEDTWPLGTAQRVEVYRIAQAALSNIARHSGAGQVRLQWLAPLDGPARLHISDDGCGFTSLIAANARGGLTHMRQRAQRLNAEFGIHSAPGEGTLITLTLTRREKIK